MSAAAAVRTEEDTLHWLALSLTAGLGPRKARELLTRYGSPNAIFRASASELESFGLHSGTARNLASGVAFEEAAAPLVEVLTRKLEGKTTKLKNPHPPDTLARFAWVVGRLGGWDGYEGHGYKPAGPKTMAIGLQQFDAIRTGWEMQRDDPLPAADV